MDICHLATLWRPLVANNTFSHEICSIYLSALCVFTICVWVEQKLYVSSKVASERLGTFSLFWTTWQIKYVENLPSPGVSVWPISINVSFHDLRLVVDWLTVSSSFGHLNFLNYLPARHGVKMKTTADMADAAVAAIETLGWWWYLPGLLTTRHSHYNGCNTRYSLSE